MKAMPRCEKNSEMPTLKLEFPRLKLGFQTLILEIQLQTEKSNFVLAFEIFYKVTL